MLVDDDHNTVRLLQMLLEMDGFEVVVAPSVELAMEQVKEEKPDAFLVDYHLADSSGEDFVRQIRALAEFAGSPIIMTSGLDHSDDALAAGASEFLIKPFEPTELSARLAALLGIA
jgi:DNA-binding response OmpR family regulator